MVYYIFLMEIDILENLKKIWYMEKVFIVKLMVLRMLKENGILIDWLLYIHNDVYIYIHIYIYCNINT